MAVVKLLDGSIEYVEDFADFCYLIEKHMGIECVNYLKSALDNKLLVGGSNGL